jgi:hypothetical protein
MLPSAPPKLVDKKYPSTQVKIGDKLYYFARLIPPERTAPPARLPAKDVPGARHRDAPGLAAPIASAKQPAPRAFVPPEIKREQLPDEILIQPASPQIQPPELTLPSFRAWTAQIPKIPKPFVAPGREAKPVPDPEPLVSPPNLTLVAANPAPPKTNSSLIVPLPPPPIEIPDLPLNASMAVPAGDPVNMIAVTRNPAFPVSSLVVPAGNTPAGASAGDSMNPSIAPNPGGTGGTGTGSGSTGLASGNSAGVVNAGPGTGAGSVPGAASGPGAGSAPAVKTVVITRPPNGNFDAVVVQSSPLDIIPSRKDLLSGRPIYTVYLALGAAKDWTFYFCVPQDSHAQSAPSSIVTLGPSTPVDAPYPVRIVRPLVTMPSFQKYLLVHGFITVAGRVERVRIIDAGAQQVDDAVLSSLIGWEFRPATRDGQPTRVEFLLAIPQAGLSL